MASNRDEENDSIKCLEGKLLKIWQNDDNISATEVLVNKIDILENQIK